MADIEVKQFELTSPDADKFCLETRMGLDYTQKIKRMTAEGTTVLFAAKVGDEFAGRATLWLDSWVDNSEGAGQDKVIDDYYENLPAVNALEVREKFRRKGVATALMNAVENEAYVRGFRRIGLGVETDNDPAIKLYEKMHYDKSPIDGNGTYHIWWQERDEKGELQKFDIECFLMIKELPRPDGSRNNEGGNDEI